MVQHAEDTINKLHIIGLLRKKKIFFFVVVVVVVVECVLNLQCDF